MGFLSNLLATVGIGGVKIDAKLTRAKVRIGESITGEIHVFGGNVDQHINEFDIILYTQAEHKTDNGTSYISLPVHKSHIRSAIQVKAGMNYTIPFEVPVPLHSPVTVGRVQLWLGTEADVTNALDAKDRDHVEILPHPAQITVLQAMEQLGFRLVKCDNEYQPYFPMRYEQEFEFAPSAEFRKYLEEIEIAFQLTETDLHVLFTVDRRARGLEQLFGIDGQERRLRITFGLDDIENHGIPYVSEHLLKVIRQHHK